MALGCSAAAWGLAPVAGAQPAQPGGDAPTAESEVLRYPPSSVRAGLIAGGLGLTAGTYLPALLSGTVWDDVPGADALKVPVVGPWVALAQSGCAPGQDECVAELVLRTALTVLDGLAQVGGVAIAAEGIFMTTEADAPAGAGPADAAPPALAVGAAPLLAPGLAGLSMVGRF